MALRRIRDSLGLTMRDVENASAIVAQRHDSQEYLIPPSRLSDIETKGVVPSVFRLYCLAAIYHKPVGELLQLYGIELDGTGADWDASRPPSSHLVALESERGLCRMPVKLDPGFDVRETSDLGRMVQQWGAVPFSLLGHLASQNYTYAFIGSEDFTMHPILQPGSFVQVDESKRAVVERHWRSEYERPIYFVETREGFACSWCSLRSNSLVLQPHPLSPTPVRILKHPQEAEVIGQVVGAAMRIGNLLSCEPQESRVFLEPKADAVRTPSDNLRVTTGLDLRSVSRRKTPG
ncbi:MAG TPA: helix-turn-helix transcriptional regulator [Terriglobales bacterium]|nr:helix-turn-helix transcriptional regulator [Terriglobales bacterium]